MRSPISSRSARPRNGASAAALLPAFAAAAAAPQTPTKRDPTMTRRSFRWGLALATFCILLASTPPAPPWDTVEAPVANGWLAARTVA